MSCEIGITKRYCDRYFTILIERRFYEQNRTQPLSQIFWISALSALYYKMIQNEIRMAEPDSVHGDEAIFLGYI